MTDLKQKNRPAVVNTSKARYRRVVCALVLLTFSGLAAATPVIDATGDFLSSFVGTKGADLDVKTAELRYDGSLFSFSTTLNGPIGTTQGALYVLGLDRGKGTARFGTTFAPGILFDEVIIVPAAGAASVRDLITNQTTVLASDAISIIGDTLNFRFSTSQATTQGFSPVDYTWAFWPRNGLGSNSQISDFAPDSANARVTVVNVPEPTTFALLGLGFVGLLCVRKDFRAYITRRTSSYVQRG